MTSNKTIQSVDNTLDAKADLKWLFYPMHGDGVLNPLQGATAESILEKNNKHEELLLSGSTVHQWNKRGFFNGSDGVTPGDRYFRVQSEDSAPSPDNELLAREMAKQTDFDNGQLIICCDYRQDAELTTDNQYLFSSGSTGAGNSAMRCYFRNASRAVLEWNIDGVINSVTNSDLVSNENATVMFVFDKYNATLRLIIATQGVVTESNVLISNAGSAVDIAPASNRGFCLFAAGHNSSVSNIFGKDAGDANRASNLLFMKSTVDRAGTLVAGESQELKQLCLDIHNSPKGVLPFSLESF